MELVPQRSRLTPTPCLDGQQGDPHRNLRYYDAPTKQTRPFAIYQIKITLNHTKPPVWRRVQVASDTTLQRLHLPVQAVMGWQDHPMHAFTVGAVHYGVPDQEMGMRSERGVKLSQLVPGEKFKFRYEYDFGDS